MALILGLIFAAIFVYIGVNLMPSQEANNSGIAGLVGVIMIVFAALIIFGVVRAIPKDTPDNDPSHTSSKVGIYIKGHKKHCLLVGSIGFLLLLLWLFQYLP